MRILLIIYTFLIVLNADDVNLRKVAISTPTENKAPTQSGDEYGVLLGLGWGLANVFTKHTISQDDTKTDSIVKNQVNAINVFLGLYSDGGHFGGRIYANASVFKTPLFSVLDGGVNLDLLINFMDSNFFNLGTIFGVGGGMYVVKLDSSLSSKSKIPLSPIGWINVGFRMKLAGSSLEFVYKMPYLYTSVYNNAISMQTPNGFQSKSDIYSLKATSLNVNYVHYF